MNRFPARDLSTKRNSVNSSLSTVKGHYPSKQVNETINKSKHSHKRFSFQSLKQQQLNPPKINDNQFTATKQSSRHSREDKSAKSKRPSHQNSAKCFNHPQKMATHIILSEEVEDDDPMYCCQRCAVQIAVKGFEVQALNKRQLNDVQNLPDIMNTANNANSSLSKVKLSQNDSKSQSALNQSSTKNRRSFLDGSSNSNFSKIYLNQATCIEMSELWNRVKTQRQTVLQKVDAELGVISEHIEHIQDYFYTLHECIEKEKNKRISISLTKKLQLENIRRQASQYFVDNLQCIQSLKKSLQGTGFCLKEEYKSMFSRCQVGKIGNMNLMDFSALDRRCYRFSQQQCLKVGEEISAFLEHQIQSSNKGSHNSKKKIESKACAFQKMANRENQNTHYEKHFQEEQIGNKESSVRSLQLSFDESECSEKVEGQSLKSNNFTLANYINVHEEESSNGTNLLLSSMEC